MDRPWQQIADLNKLRRPGILPRFHPRKYRTPKGYCSSWQVAVALGCAWTDDIGALQRFRNLNDSGNALRAAAIAHRLLHLQVPLYHVAGEFAQALLHTDLPAIPTEELRWAMPGAVFLLPRGLIFNPGGWPLEHLAVATYGSGQPGAAQFTLQSDGDDYFGFSTSIAEGTDEANQVSDYSGVVHKGQFATLDQMPLAVGDRFHIATLDPLRLQQCDAQSEQEFSALLRTLAIHLMLALGQPKRFVESQTEPQTVPTSKGFGKRQQEATEQLWEPNWLGRSYRQQQDTETSEGRAAPTSEGTHARPRSHWRRGHWRRVPYGPMNVSPRPVHRILIDPVLINPDVVSHSEQK